MVEDFFNSNQTLRKKVEYSLRNCNKNDIQVDGGDDINIRIGTPSQKLVSDRLQEHNSQQTQPEEVNLVEQEKSQKEVHIQLTDVIKWTRQFFQMKLKVSRSHEQR